MDSITITLLADFPDQLEQVYHAIPEQFRNWRPPSWDGIPSEPFTPIEQICHVRDIEIEGYHVRLRRTLDEDNPDLASIDSIRVTAERAYASENPANVFDALRRAREATLDLLSGLTPAQLDRPARFEGPTTLRGLAHFLCSHDQQHLAGLQWLMAKSRAA
ncbi:MAG TPA: DinB family protein [Rudaea sp.]